MTSPSATQNPGPPSKAAAEAAQVWRKMETTWGTLLFPNQRNDIEDFVICAITSATAPLEARMAAAETALAEARRERRLGSSLNSATITARRRSARRGWPANGSGYIFVF